MNGMPVAKGFMLWFSGTILLTLLVWLLGEQLTAHLRYQKQVERRFKSTVVDFNRSTNGKLNGFH